MIGAPHAQRPAVEKLLLIAGRGAYPLELAEAATRTGGVRQLDVIAFRGETARRIRDHAARVHWLYLGQLQRMLDTMAATGIRHAVMAGQIKPTHLYNVRPDRAMFDLLSRLRERNAETIFGAIGEALLRCGIELLPAWTFMESNMPAAGVFTRRPPTDQEQADIALGLRVAKLTSGLDIGQTVVIKEGTVLAVEAFEGTDAAIRRAGKLGGAGAVVVKVAKPGHDMRFDIPVVGLHTLKTLRKARVSAMAVEAGRTILLERREVIALADRLGISMLAVEAPADNREGTP